MRPRRPDPRVSTPHQNAITRVGNDGREAREAREDVGALQARVLDLQAQLASERRERELEAGTMGEMLVRLAAAEAKARAAEGSMANATDEASEAEGRVREIESSIAEAVGMLEELEQRERSLAELRARVLREVRDALTRASRARA